MKQLYTHQTIRTTTILTVILCVIFLPSTAFAHSGRLDANGGHNKRADGTYHYHAEGDRTNEYASPPGQAGILPSAQPSGADAVVVQVTLNGEPIPFDQPPAHIGGRILLPLRPVVEKMGCTVSWDGVAQTVYVMTEAGAAPAEKGAAQNEIGEIAVFVDNTQIVFADQPPVNNNGRVLVPIRSVVERLGYVVDWNAETQTVVITAAA